ncbi:MAG: 7TM-DISM domain-containing protein [Clostridium sp.]|nr:7TM-DISM domain-containing protein [Clostridium sp.]
MFKKKKLAFIFLLIILFISSACSNRIPTRDFEIEKGSIDLREINFEKDIVQLNTKWEFYWKELLEPDEIHLELSKNYINVPGTWNKFSENKEAYSGDGFGTYRLRFIVNEDQKLGVKIPRIRSAYRIWINGEEKSSAGIVAENKKEMKAQYQPQVDFFEGQKGENEIVIQVSNFHQRNGGILESISLGNEKKILRQRYISIGRDIFLFAGLFTISIYNLSFFVFRRQNKSFLYFGALSLLLALRNLLVRETMFAFWFPGFSFELAAKIQALTFYLGVPLFLMLIESIFPGYLKKIVIKTSKIIGGLFALLVVITRPRLFTSLNIIYQIWSLILLV